MTRTVREKEMAHSISHSLQVRFSIALAKRRSLGTFPLGLGPLHQSQRKRRIGTELELESNLGFIATGRPD